VNSLPGIKSRLHESPSFKQRQAQQKHLGVAFARAAFDLGLCGAEDTDMRREGEVWRVLLGKTLQLPHLFIVMDKTNSGLP